MSVNLDAIKAYCVKATPGPWRWWNRGLFAADNTLIADDGSGGGEYAPVIDVDGPDAVFIANARQDLPACVDEIEALRNRLSATGDGALCYYCQKTCNDLSANPGLWSIPLCHADAPGVVKWHHVECVSQRLVEVEVLRKIAEAAERFVSMNDTNENYRSLKAALAQWKESK